MHAYNKNSRVTKGLAGRRRSCDTPHRRRCLRVDKKAARRYKMKWGIDNYQPDDWKDW